MDEIEPDVVGYVYGVRNVGSKEYRYVGLTQSSTARRLRRHISNARQGQKTPFYDWLRREGAARVTIDVLESVTTSREDLGAAEIRWIADLRRAGDRLLNIAAGGLGPTGVVWTDEQREAARRRSTGRPGVSRYGSDNPFFGRTHTPEQRALWTKSRSGTNAGANNPNFGKFGPDHLGCGRVVTVEQRRELSAAKRGARNPNYGKKASAETRAKRSAALKGRPMPSSRRSAHTRYHTNRGVMSEKCAFCQEALAATKTNDQSKG